MPNNLSWVSKFQSFNFN